VGNVTEGLSDAKTRDSTIVAVLKDRQNLIRELIKILEDPAAKDTTKVVAVYLLGEYRSVEASDAILDNIGVRIPGRMGTIPKYGWPTGGALQKIACPENDECPVVSKILSKLEIVEAEDINGSLSYALWRIKGADGSVKLLTNRLSITKDEKVRGRLKRALGFVTRIEKETKQSEGHR